MIQYLAKFLPNLSNDIAPVRALTKKYVPFVWNEGCEAAFKTVKNKISQAPVLSYFDNQEPLTLQADSSKGGFGAAILQNGKPIEFASRSLTPAEKTGPKLRKSCLQ